MTEIPLTRMAGALFIACVLVAGCAQTGASSKQSKELTAPEDIKDKERGSGGNDAGVM